MAAGRVSSALGLGRLAVQHDVCRILRLAMQQPPDRVLRLVVGAAHRQPIGAFRDEEPSEGDDDRRDQSGGKHPAPGIKFRHQHQAKAAHAGAAQRAQRLEAEGAEHQLAAAGAGDVLRNDHVRGRVVAAQRHAETEQADRQREEIGAEDQQREEGAEDDHLGDEHPLAAEIVGQAAEQDGAEQDAEQAGGADDALFSGADMEFAHNQRQRDTGHENHEAFEEFARRGETPDAPLHRRSSAPISGWCRPTRPAARRYTPARIWYWLVRAAQPLRHRSCKTPPKAALWAAISLWLRSGSRSQSAGEIGHKPSGLACEVLKSDPGTQRRPARVRCFDPGTPLTSPSPP